MASHASYDSEKETLEIGVIGLGDMGLMYAKRIIDYGWKKYENFYLSLYKRMFIIIKKKTVTGAQNTFSCKGCVASIHARIDHGDAHPAAVNRGATQEIGQ